MLMKLLLCFFMTSFFGLQLVYAQSTTLQEEKASINSILIESDEIKNLNADRAFDVKITNLVFKKVNAKHQIKEFTTYDADIIIQYLMAIGGVMTVKADAINKSFRIISKREVDGRDPLPLSKVATELSQIGYLPTSARAYQDIVLFAAKSKCAHRNVRDGLVITTRDKIREYTDDCYDCGDVEVSEETEEKYKKMDYGGGEIDFGMDAVETPTSNDIPSPTEEVVVPSEETQENRPATNSNSDDDEKLDQQD